jgi:hypothetical protein
MPRCLSVQVQPDPEPVCSFEVDVTHPRNAIHLIEVVTQRLRFRRMFFMAVFELNHLNFVMSTGHESKSAGINRVNKSARIEGLTSSDQSISYFRQFVSVPKSCSMVSGASCGTEVRNSEMMDEREICQHGLGQSEGCNGSPSVPGGGSRCREQNRKF